MKLNGLLRKMKSDYKQDTGDVTYFLNIDGDTSTCMNDAIGKEVTISFTKGIRCAECGKKIRKTYGDGLCYPCTISLPQGDMCILKPHQCHFHLGTCRDSKWGEEHCFIPHTLYLAKSSSIKIGITRQGQQFTRWVDQGASEAMAIGTFPSRKEVGIAELAISEKMSDRTNWRKMLTNEIAKTDFSEFLAMAQDLLTEEQKALLCEAPKVFSFNYPVQKYPDKVNSFTLDKVPVICKTLTGIKGQYLIFGNEVINLRSHTGYIIDVTIE
jgi:hypothetical protein